MPVAPSANTSSPRAPVPCIPSGSPTAAKPVSSPYKLRVKWEHLAAGVSGGVISTLVLHPLDLVKVRFQVNEGSAVAANRPQYNSIYDAFGKIHKHEGLRGLYQGVTPNVWGSGASWGLYFLFYSSIKTYMQGGDDNVALSAPQHMTAAAEAGVLTLAITNPIWVAKTRMCLQYESLSNPSAVARTEYRGMADCLLKTYQAEGVRGLYKGFIPGLIGVSHGAIQFMAYEELKKFYNKRRNRPASSKFNTGEYIVFAAMSKILAASVTYPYQVVRARLQDQHRQYTGIWDVIVKTWNGESWRGFYKGLWPSLIRVVPACCITFAVYENMVSALS